MEPQPVLDYSTHRQWREWWLVRKWQQVPPVVCALGFYFTAWLIAILVPIDDGFSYTYRAHIAPCLYVIAVWVAGSLRRLEWRQLLLTTIVGVGVWIVDLFRWLPSILPFPYSWLAWPALMIAPAVLVEMMATRKRERTSVARALLLGVAASCGVCVLLKVVQFSEKPLVISWANGDPTDWSNLIGFPAIIVMVWLAVPLLLKFRRSSNPMLFACVGAAAAACIGFVLFSTMLMYQEAARTIAGKGFFSKSASMELLALRDTPQDRRAIWDGLEHADWSANEGYAWQDYRYAAIHELSAKDPRGTTEQLSMLLARQPSARLAAYSGQMLVDAGLYDSVPILIRYALQQDSECLDTLVKAKVPQAMLPFLVEELIDYRDLVSMVVSDFRLPPSAHDKLVALAGTDAGWNYSDWIHFYDRNVASLPTPLNPKQSADADREIALWVKYTNAMADLRDAGMAGTVKAPNWNLPDTARLEAEVDQYSKQVKATIEGARGGASKPAAGAAGG